MAQAGDAKLIKQCMSKIMVGTGSDNLQHGKDFYKLYVFSIFFN